MNMPILSLRQLWITLCLLIVVVMAWANIQPQTVIKDQHSYTAVVHASHVAHPAAQVDHTHCDDNSSAYSPSKALCQAVCALHCVGVIPPKFELASQLYFPARFPPAVDVAIPSLHLAPTPPPPKRV